MRPTGGAGAESQVCHGETMSAAYADMYTRPLDETATAGQNVSTRRAAGATSVPTGYPIAVRFDASSVAKIGTAAVHVFPPSVDLLYIAAAWHPFVVPN